MPIIEANSGRNCCPRADAIIIFPWEVPGTQQHLCGNFGYPPAPRGCWNCEDDNVPATVDKMFCSIKCKKEYTQ